MGSNIPARAGRQGGQSCGWREDRAVPSDYLDVAGVLRPLGIKLPLQRRESGVVYLHVVFACNEHTKKQKTNRSGGVAREHSPDPDPARMRDVVPSRRKNNQSSRGVTYRLLQSVVATSALHNTLQGVTTVIC